MAERDLKLHTQQGSSSQAMTAALVAFDLPSYQEDIDPENNSPLSQTKKRVPDFLGQQAIVTINVTSREDRHTFLVHKYHLCYHSPLFDAALNGKFVESDTQTVTLEGVSPKVFNVFVTWIYTQRLEQRDGKTAEYTMLIPLWMLADRLLVPKLQNDCARSFMSRKGRLSVSSFRHIYDITRADSPLRRMLVDKLVVFLGSRAGSAFDYKNIPREMLVEILEALRKRMPEDSSPFQSIFRDPGAYLVSEDVIERR